MANINSDKIPAKVFAAIIATGLMFFCGVIVETSNCTHYGNSEG
jgi:hypothetical protein